MDAVEKANADKQKQCAEAIGLEELVGTENPWVEGEDEGESASNPGRKHNRRCSLRGGAHGGRGSYTVEVVTLR